MNKVRVIHPETREQTYTAYIWLLLSILILFGIWAENNLNQDARYHCKDDPEIECPYIWKQNHYRRIGSI